MTIAELAERLHVSPRQIRFLIAEDILPAAQKTGRSADAYGEDHLNRAERYFALYRMGMKPASIQVLMAFDDAVPIYQSGGVELRVGPTPNPADVNLDNLIDEISKALRIYFGKE